jgi:hypothetical protein
MMQGVGAPRDPAPAAYDGLGELGKSPSYELNSTNRRRGKR